MSDAAAAALRFPDGFLWGASTAGHQVEGGNVNADIWPLEWAEPSLFTEPSGDACDHYHRYPEDIATLSTSGVQTWNGAAETLKSIPTSINASAATTREWFCTAGIWRAIS